MEGPRSAHEPLRHWRFVCWHHLRRVVYAVSLLTVVLCRCACPSWRVPPSLRRGHLAACLSSLLVGFVRLWLFVVVVHCQEFVRLDRDILAKGFDCGSTGCLIVRVPHNEAA